MVIDNIPSIATSALPLDPAIIITNTIPSIIGLVIAVLTGAGLLLKWYRDNIGKEQGGQRDAKISEGLDSLLNSLKGTDISVKDNAELIQGIVRLMMKVPQVKQELDVNADLLDKINTNAERWKKGIESYYEKTSRMPGDDSKDLIIRRVAEMQKQTVPND
jgi:hypothetical protein